MFSPTAEEQTKILQLKTSLKDHLKGNSVTNPKVRDELKKAAANSEFLFKYIRGRKLNVNRAFENILHYAEVKCIIYPEYFPVQVPDYLRYAIECKLLNVLSKKDSLGRTYVLIDSTNYDDSKISKEECASGFRFVVEGLMNSPEFLDNGIVLLHNSKGMQLKHAKNASSETKFYLTFWRSFPVKLKAVIYFNTPMYVKFVSSVVIPLIKSKVADRAHISSGLGDLHKRVSLDILPMSLGGKLTEEEAIMPTEKVLALACGKAT